jgi:predicted metal-binding membrane protein
MSTMATMSPATTMGMTAAMMVAMMLPSIAPNIWRYHRHLRAMDSAHRTAHTVLFVAGYAAVWAAIGLALAAISVAASPMHSPAPVFSPPVVALAVLFAGALQRSPWKARHLLRCRNACGSTHPTGVGGAVLDGCRLGIECGRSCAAPMMVLLVWGLSSTPMMLLITGVVSAERLAPAGLRIARLSGTVAIAAGLMLLLSVAHR